MKRGDIFYAYLSPPLGSEMDKRRPVLIVSNDANNRAATTVTVLPLTSNVNRVYRYLKPM
jgi:mRNA interferase MazF